MAVVPSALGKNKHQAVWVKTVPLLFCVRCSSFPDRLDAGEIIRCTDSSRENCIFVPERVMYRYFPCHTILLYTKFACKVGIPARFNKRKQNKRYGEKTISLVFYATIFVEKYSRKQSNRGGKTKNGEQKKPYSDFFHSP